MPRRCIDKISITSYNTQADVYNLMNTESPIDKRYREKILEYYFDQPLLKGCQRHPKWVAPCPFCSPGRKSESKRNEKVCALIWVESWNTWTFTCKRDACAYKKLSFPRLIEALNPVLYREYKRERLHSGSTGNGRKSGPPSITGQHSGVHAGIPNKASLKKGRWQI